jgi:hypothetical protein
MIFIWNFLKQLLIIQADIAAYFDYQMLRQNEMKNCNYPDTELHLYYGGEFFKSLDSDNDIWDEIIDYLTRNRLENSSEKFSIPDFWTSDVMYNALLHLPTKYWLKLLSVSSKYDLLRKEMFSSGDNLEKAKKNWAIDLTIKKI